jgi:hypothetical protein
MDERNSRFRVRDAFSYPDAFCSVSAFSRLTFVVLNTPAEWFDTIRAFSPGVHQHPSVSLPPKIEYTIALNLKHLFHTEPNFSLPLLAFQHLERTVRIQWAMKDLESKPGFLSKFHLKSDWVPPVAAPHIEAGLEAGKSELFSQLPYVTHHSKPSASAEQRRDRMSVLPLRRYLIENQYLCLITDKNLGIAVVPLDWYDRTMRDHIQAGPYEIRAPNHESLKQDCLRLDFSHFGGAINAFVQSFPIPRGLPKFYGIPKIHKNPWAIRPIVPCHDWYTVNVGKAVDHLLQPLMIKLFPWVIQSSKQLLQILNPFMNKKVSHLMFATGDVKSMYTNIPIQGIVLVLREIQHEFPSILPPNAFDQLVAAVIYVNMSCYFDYQGVTYWQKDGLAMGSPCAPVLANIYMGWYERKHRFVPTELVYVRYIDDILWIADRSTNSLPTPLVRRVSAPNLEVEWATSRDSISFLDVELYRKSNTVQTRIFRKNLNHFQYIPWSSSHPRHVLKGMTKGELIRFLRASSLQSNFEDARTMFWHHLRARGYPYEILKRWFTQVHWTSRGHFLSTKVKEQRDPPLMLPSHYNLIWDSVLVRRIQEAMMAVWSTDEVPAPLRQKLITSLSRTVSLFDYTRNWNKHILFLNQDNSDTSSESEEDLPFEELHGAT